ncbi:macrolide transport system ATP-binding/permease protein/pleuromutilin/lincosamide/streptogramin A transport system ATP-binding/permease protein [Thalassobacillus cyri]|uniref:Macrolide transport system ATP-binding/permease protein/pleuromutilin/lincosamide/streptogramin A transport system ATP-binding/permease protein n=1 Tax=Thalassobacillus cyri TaxID=571932 RepID=A0A1H4HG99_9BACI|nr:ABC-F type ribosomal protection protein [Thalassobacillus cyri]SEB20711.1 macrolide transport system ATP-binding/permease protein/pleuromutilin/lincosamide/streptogramin A transport system ATP-binding/permease protein [Thalassobacillus cyri]
MLLMRAMNIQFTIGPRRLLDIEELKIHKGDRIGLVGKNGQGKTLLLNYLAGKTEMEPQVDFHTDFSWFQQLGDPDNHDNEWKTLSGGEKTLAKLERLFAEDSDLLFLDEPTNNLDWQHIEQLERQLENHQGAFLIVSHDRSLLGKVCTTIWHLEDGKITSYQGDYSFYADQKELEHKQQQEAHEKYLKEKKRLTERLTKKRKQAKGMRKPPSRMGNSEWQLGKNKAAGQQKKIERVSKNIENRMERLEKVDKPFEWEEVKMDYVLHSPIHRKQLLMAKDVHGSVAGRELYQVPFLKLTTGSKTALIGANGSGKTTLIQQLLKGGETVDFAAQVKIGHFDQMLKSLPVKETVLQYVQSTSQLPEHLLRIILGRLRFKADDVHKTIGVLSGGERVKVALARLLTGDFNLLILDEPTNHLDLEAIEALEGLVRDYPGTVLYVTHDRRFVDRTTTHLWVLEEQTVHSFEGSLEEYGKVKQKPKEVEEQEYNMMTLETKLTELVSRISMAPQGEDNSDLEEEYQQVLGQIRKLRNS